MPKFLPVRLDDAKKKQIAKMAIDRNTSMNALINQAIDDFLLKHKPEKEKTNES